MKPRIAVARLLSSSLLAAFLAAAAAACGSNRPAVSAADASCAQIPLHFHIAVDRSASIDTQWPNAIEGVKTAIGQIPDGALLHVYTFADDVNSLGTWRIDPAERGRILRDVAGSMGAEASGDWTYIHRMADTLAERIRSAPAAQHVVFFVSDDEEDAPGYPDTARARVQADWGALNPRIPSSLRVVAVRLGTGSSFRTIVPSADTAMVVRIADVGARIAREIENDPFARQRKRERREPLLSAALASDPQQVPYPGGDVRVAVTSAANCGVYLLADGTEVRPGQTVLVGRRVASPLGFMEGLFGRGSLTVPLGDAAPADLLRPRVARYIQVQGAGSQDTVYASAGYELPPVSGDVVFTPAPWWLRLIAIVAGVFLAVLTLFLFVWPLLPPLGGELQTTLKFDPNRRDVNLRLARAGREVSVAPPPPGPGISVRLERASRWGSPWNTVLVFRVVGDGSVGVAKENAETGAYQVTWLSSEHSAHVREPAFILWPKAAEPERPNRLAAGKPDNYPGYLWTP